MTIQICSDLHLEFNRNRTWLAENPIIPKADLLIVAGDTFYIGDDYKKYSYLDQLSADFETVYLIPGNHEYYGGFDASTAAEQTYEAIRENIFLVNNYTLDLDGYQLIFSTMWSEIKRNKWIIRKFIPDFQKIKFKGESLQIDDFNWMHEKCFDFIESALTNSEKNIIVTHHLPSRLCTSKEFKNSPVNDVFCVDKTDFIESANIDYWIYGHSHRNIGDFEIGGTKMITNQLEQ